MSEPQPSQLSLAHLDGIDDALARAHGASLEDLYDGWRRLLVTQAGAALRRASERETLDLRAGMLLRSVENARALMMSPVPAASADAPPDASLAAADPLGSFIAESQRELEGAREALRRRAEDEERFFQSEIAQVKARVQQHADTLLAHHRPRVEAQVQPVGRDRSLVHLVRPEPQELLLFAYVVSGKLFTRFDAFLDDSVDELGPEPPRFYREEGNDSVRFDRLEDEEALLDDPSQRFVPVKGMISLRIPGRAFPRFRLMNRGPLIEAEARPDGRSPYEHLMPREAAELLVGFLIKLKIDRRIELVLKLA
ncbi:MAG: hypothetical protein HY901_24885 [Deltaproteobacteria bacterium]|nr:hypothetical protein [Deltaproteobacteria bacterium]